jgi:hypothetical protein
MNKRPTPTDVFLLEDLLQTPAYKPSIWHLLDEDEHLPVALPPMGATFYALWHEWNQPPTPALFTEAICQLANPELNQLSVRYRAGRAYMSFVREAHLQTMLLAFSDLSEVVYSSELDMHYGVDLFLLHRGRAMGVQSFLDTPANRRWHINRRHRPLATLPLLQLAVNPKSCRVVGPYWLHPWSHVPIVCAEMTGAVMGVWLSKQVPHLWMPEDTDDDALAEAS